MNKALFVSVSGICSEMLYKCNPRVLLFSCYYFSVVLQVSTVYLWIRLCDVRAARTVRRAGSSQWWTGDVEHLPRRAEVPFGLAPHVQIGGEGFYSRDSGRGGWKAGDVY